jgi:hypothetical protein
MIGCESGLSKPGRRDETIMGLADASVPVAAALCRIGGGH